jgi:hypothetical protein
LHDRKGELGWAAEADPGLGGERRDDVGGEIGRALIEAALAAYASARTQGEGAP